MKILNKLIYSRSYTIPANSTQKITIPDETYFDEYIINKDANVQYIIYFTYSHEDFNIQYIKRAILINRIMGNFSGARNIFFYSLLDFDFIKENNSILLKDIKNKMFRIYVPNTVVLSDPPEFLIMEIQNTSLTYDLDIYLELRELNAVLL